jgi:hypothetical protein
MSFSIATVYWGGQKNLDNFIDHCLQYTDDIVVVYIDLFGYNIKSDKAKIVYLDYSFLLNNGYAKTFNLARNYTSNDWVYLLGVGKEIVEINNSLLSELNDRTEAAFSVMKEGDNFTKWFKISNVEKTNMVGVIHEEPVPMVINNYQYEMSESIFATWKYSTTDYDSEYEKNVCDGYRALSRLKWYHLNNTSGVKVQPESFINSMEYLKESWRLLDENFLSNLYEKYSYLYDLDRDSLVKELSLIDVWRQYGL